ncbi:MarR family winged helix-turn-helix transcriptional regulator [Sutcliffiella halmapala]|uniref:MarR family winged helix-turn-helix transcriptional regulator n=1 Tax=Sutcliffiella halmapala TaxID=79882 RepID=UPI000994913A|nr:MarR family transcriptional regulator [Sutcliffiella halmapala]
MNEEEKLSLSNLLCFNIYACSREITKLYTPILKEIKLTYPQYLVMVVLWEQDEIPIKILGSKLYLDTGTLTPLLKRLQEAGLITRERSVEDERIVNISLTNKGEELKEKAKNIPIQIFEKSKLSQQQIDELINIIKNLHSNLLTK